MLRKTNIQEKLNRERNRTISKSSVFSQIEEILKLNQSERERILDTISNGVHKTSNEFDFDILKTENIYHIDQIQKICIDYRLRFLNSSFFKGEIPAEAISKIRRLEKAHDTTIDGLKILAPSKLFKLEDKDDPLLFAPIGNDYFYLIHKWGNDLHPLRKLLMWPFKSVVNLTLVVILCSYLVTLMVPDGLFSKNSTTAQFWIIFFFMFKCMASVVIFYGFALGKNFTPAIWNSKYFNS
ncbi:hypothetical protein B0O79_0214 [Flavobacteriaceae bacterium MAR_2009_75]|nr:hypothetical protein B0O79_0214 [Flavobacteriaceae bacterium MAR_2009_75]